MLRRQRRWRFGCGAEKTCWHSKCDDCSKFPHSASWPRLRAFPWMSARLFHSRIQCVCLPIRTVRYVIHHLIYVDGRVRGELSQIHSINWNDGVYVGVSLNLRTRTEVGGQNENVEWTSTANSWNLTDDNDVTSTTHHHEMIHLDASDFDNAHTDDE